MELFRDDGCLTDEGLRALVAGQLDELGRLEVAEHLSYCGSCLERYTALLAGGALVQPPRDLSRPVGRTLLIRLMNNLYGRALVASAAALLALTLWRSGGTGLLLARDNSLEVYIPQQVAPPASAAIPPAELEEPPRPGERQAADAVVEKARQAVSGFLGSLTGGPDTT